MAESDTGMLLFGLAVLLGMGLLFWKLSVPTGKTTLTEFVRDDQGRVIQIIERAS
jgi:hypothetical protein